MTGRDDFITLSSDSDEEFVSSLSRNLTENASVSEENEVATGDRKPVFSELIRADGAGAGVSKKSTGSPRAVAYKSTSKASAAKLATLAREKLDLVEKRATRARNNEESRILKETAEFMGKFDPERSNREKRKLSQKISMDLKSPVKSGPNTGCDCFNDNCTGCFFPCPTCKSQKCSVICRVNRTIMITSVEMEASNSEIAN